ncbi:MAG: hypothetical protein Q9185_001978 [Variospora sp. 1 TL-2023]
MTSPAVHCSTATGLETCHNSTKDAIEHHNDDDQHHDIGNNNKTPCHDLWPASEGQKKNDSQPPPPFTGIIVEEQPNLPRVYPALLKRSIIITALCLGTLLDAIDITIIGVAVPTISAEFNALDDVGWYGSAYLLSLTALQPVFGVVYKFFDPKTVYLCSVLVFEAGSIMSAAAPSSPVFILGRAVTGCGGAGLLQGALCIVALSVPIEKRPLYLSIVMINDTDTYYIPFYFQATQGASAISSGAKFIALVLPEIVAIVVTGAIVSKIGHYVPFMIGGACIAALGTGLLTRITLGTPTVQWAAYLVISGLGIGLGLNLPYTALHVVLSEEDVPIGNGE